MICPKLNMRCLLICVLVAFTLAPGCITYHLEHDRHETKHGCSNPALIVTELQGSTMDKRKDDKLTVSRICELVLEAMSTEERNKHVVYVDEAVHSSQSELHIGKTRLRLDYDAVVVFIDEEPGVNWGHACRYLLYNVATGEVSEVRETFPPSLTEAPGTYRLVLKPTSVPDWAVWSGK